MNYLGLDPGKHGAVVVLSPDGGVLDWWRTPLAAKDYDGPAMQRIARASAVMSNAGLRAFLEAPAVYGLYSSLAYTVGFGFGRWMHALESEQVSIGRIVPASVWTAMFLPAKRKGMSKKDRKAHLVAQARRLQPEKIPWDTLNQQARSGVADALLIAEWGRRKG